MVLPDQRLILLVEKAAVECVAAKPFATTVRSDALFLTTPPQLR